MRYISGEWTFTNSSIECSWYFNQNRPFPPQSAKACMGWNLHATNHASFPGNSLSLAFACAKCIKPTEFCRRAAGTFCQNTLRTCLVQSTVGKKISTDSGRHAYRARRCRPCDSPLLSCIIMPKRYRLRRRLICMSSEVRDPKNRCREVEWRRLQCRVGFQCGPDPFQRSNVQGPLLSSPTLALPLDEAVLIFSTIFPVSTTGAL